MNRILIFGIFVLAAAGCAREVSNTSKIRLEAPANQAGSMAAIPINQKPCYGVSVKGSNLGGGPVNSCSPDLGLIGGYASAGETLELEVAKGSGYTIDLYLYLKDIGDNSACPVFTRTFSANDLNHVYHVGTAAGVNLSKDEEVVTISSFFPGVGATIAGNYASNCSNVSSASNVFRISSGSGLVSGASYKVRGRIGSVQGGQVLSGGGYKIVTNK